MLASESVTSLADRSRADAQSSSPAARRTRRILVLSSVFPSSAQPTFGVFVKERIRAIADQPGIEVRVVSPTPWFPPIKMLPRWYPWSQTPRRDQTAGIAVERPRYLLPPKIGGYLHPQLMFRTARNAVARIRREFDFDLIDAHFAWPNGALAAMLGREFGKPVVITGRGEDMLRFPSLPVIGKGIRAAVRASAHCIALSGEIAEAFRSAGAAEDRISIVPNGVDTEAFQLRCQSESRQRLGLPQGRRIVLAVGDLQERKGFYLLVEAVAKVREQFPDVLAVIVGGPPRSGPNHQQLIETSIRSRQLEQHVLLAGPVRHEDLPMWYNAADFFVLLSSREGSPNVLLEALACGLPVVATPAGETADLLANEQLGILLEERSSACAAEGIHRAFSHTWKRAAIREFMLNRSWNHAAQKVTRIFDHVLDGML